MPNSVESRVGCGSQRSEEAEHWSERFQYGVGAAGISTLLVVLAALVAIAVSISLLWA